jgi:thiol:disulfide interchange protein DsbC
VIVVVPTRIVVLLVVLAAAAPVLAQPSSELPATLKRLYPATAFDAVAATPVPGLSEVVMGTNVAYVDGSGRYFLFGRLFDMQTQRDLTAERIEHLSAIDFGVLPLEAAIKTVRGAGSRVLAVFSDPDCPHCRTLEHTLATLDDLTVYTFLYPVEALHPGAREKAIAAWCAPDRSKAWSTLMLRGAAPPPVSCSHPIDRIIALGAELRVLGTPTLFAGDGRRAVGAQSAPELDAWLRAAAARQAETAR